jgi:hypothetical protein
MNQWSRLFFLIAAVLCSTVIADNSAGRLSGADLSAARRQFYKAVSDNSAAAKRKVVNISDSRMVHTSQEYIDNNDISVRLPSLAKAAQASPAIASQSAGPFEVGDTRLFFVRDVITDAEGYFRSLEILGKLIAQSAHANIWLLDDDDYHAKTETVHTDICHLTNITEGMALMIAESFDPIYEAMTDPVTGFAPHAGVVITTGMANMPQVGDIGGDGKINFLLYDIHGDGAVLPPGMSRSYTAGFFWTAEFTNNQGSALDMLHIDIGEGQGYEVFKAPADSERRLRFFSTLAHEFQHLLYYMYYGVYNSDNYTRFSWFNEALAELASAFYVNPGTEITDNSRILYAAQNSYDGFGGYRDFLNRANGLKNYGMERLFAHVMYKAYPQFPAGVYNYLRTTFPPAQNSAQMNANRSKVTNATIGDMLRSGMGGIGKGGLNSLETAYFLFMDSFAADGGTIYADAEYKTMKLYTSTARDHNIWYCRSRFVPTMLPSGGKTELKGYFRGYSGTPTWGATHDMKYKLEGSGNSETPFINIRISDDGTTGTHYYLACVSPLSPPYGAGDAEVYILTKGIEHSINTKGKDVYLLGATFFQDTESKVGYSWSAEGAAAVDFKGDKLRQKFSLRQHGRMLRIIVPGQHLQQNSHQQVMIFNIAGKRQKIKPVFCVDGTVLISLSNLAAGSYIVRVNGNQDSWNRRIIVR